MMNVIADTATQRTRETGGTDFCTIKDLCDRLGMSRTMAYTLAAMDALPVPVIRLGSGQRQRYRFSRRALDKLAGADDDDPSGDGAR